MLHLAYLALAIEGSVWVSVSCVHGCPKPTDNGDMLDAAMEQ